jgi:hypothetical protein
MAKVTAYAFGPIMYATEGGRQGITMKITDQMVIDSIIDGTLRGLSPESVIRRWDCSICGENYEDCEHENGQKYGDEICRIIRKDFDFTGQSLVPKPFDERCRIEDLLLIHNNGATRFVWYGFKPNKANFRFKHIQDATDKKIIPEEVSHFFARAFAENLISTQDYVMKK